MNTLPTTVLVTRYNFLFSSRKVGMLPENDVFIVLSTQKDTSVLSPSAVYTGGVGHSPAQYKVTWPVLNVQNPESLFNFFLHQQQSNEAFLMPGLRSGVSIVPHRFVSSESGCDYPTKALDSTYFLECAFFEGGSVLVPYRVWRLFDGKKEARGFSIYARVEDLRFDSRFKERLSRVFPPIRAWQVRPIFTHMYKERTKEDFFARVLERLLVWQVDDSLCTRESLPFYGSQLASLVCFCRWPASGNWLDEHVGSVSVRPGMVCLVKCGFFVDRLALILQCPFKAPCHHGKEDVASPAERFFSPAPPKSSRCTNLNAKSDILETGRWDGAAQSQTSVGPLC